MKYKMHKFASNDSIIICYFLVVFHVIHTNGRYFYTSICFKGKKKIQKIFFTKKKFFNFFFSSFHSSI